VVAVLDQRHPHIGTVEPGGQAERRLPRHIRIALTLQQPNRAAERDRRAQHQPGAPVLDQRAGDRQVLAVLARRVDHAVGQQPRALRRQHCCPHHILGKIGRGGDPDQAHDPARTRQRQQQGDPAAHAGPHENERAGDAVHHRHRIRGPHTDGPVRERAATGAMAGIIQPEAGLARRPAKRGGLQRLRSPHVTAQPR